MGGGRASAGGARWVCPTRSKRERSRFRARPRAQGLARLRRPSHGLASEFAGQIGQPGGRRLQVFIGPRGALLLSRAIVRRGVRTTQFVRERQVASPERAERVHPPAAIRPGLGPTGRSCSRLRTAQRRIWAAVPPGIGRARAGGASFQRSNEWSRPRWDLGSSVGCATPTARETIPRPRASSPRGGPTADPFDSRGAGFVDRGG